MSVSKFIEQYMPAAIAAGNKIGVSPHVLLGQWGLETGWGKSVIPGTNNLGNIKDFSGNGATAKDNMTGSVDKYRVYETPEAFAEDYANLIGKNKRYAAALGSGADPVKFASALKQGGYAEDGAYVQKMAKASEMVGSAILNKIGNNIVQDLKGGATPEQVVLALRNSPTIGSDVTQALKEGKPIERILEVAGGQAYQDYVKSSPTYGMGAIQKGVVGLGKAMQEGIDGTKELYHAATGNEKALAEDRARTAERQRLDAPLMATTAGKVGYMAGKALPYVVAGTATGGTSLLPQLAVQGTVGAVDPRWPPQTAPLLASQTAPGRTG